MKNLKQKLVNSKVSIELYEKLKNIWDSENWILGNMFNLNEDQKAELLEMINSGETNRNRISIKAMEFQGLVGIPDEEFDGNPEDVINIDEE